MPTVTKLIRKPEYLEQVQQEFIIALGKMYELEQKNSLEINKLPMKQMHTEDNSMGILLAVHKNLSNIANLCADYFSIRKSNINMQPTEDNKNLDYFRVNITDSYIEAFYYLMLALLYRSHHTNQDLAYKACNVLLVDFLVDYYDAHKYFYNTNIKNNPENFNKDTELPNENRIFWILQETHKCLLHLDVMGHLTQAGLPVLNPFFNKYFSNLGTLLGIKLESIPSFLTTEADIQIRRCHESLRTS